MKHLLLTTIAAVLLVGCAARRSGLIHGHAMKGNVEALRRDLIAGANVNLKLDGITALHRSNDRETTRLLIRFGADVNAKQKGSFWTPLHFASQDGHKGVAELLIAKGADVNAKDIDGQTPLMVAALRKHKEIAELLIAKGADVNAKDEKDGATPLHRAVYVVKRVLRSTQLEIVKLLIAEGADVNVKIGQHQSTPLRYAAYYGHKEVAELLLAKGAGVNAKDTDGKTPLDWAIKQKRTETADLLRKHGGKTGEELKAEGK